MVHQEDCLMMRRLEECYKRIFHHLFANSMFYTIDLYMNRVQDLLAS
jgi:hypothetical protein